MKFNLDEFEVEESIGNNDKEQENQRRIIEAFKDEEIKKTISKILIRETSEVTRFTIRSNIEPVGEITFSRIREKMYEIGIVIEPPFRNQGIAYRILKALMFKFSSNIKVDCFIYNVRNDNMASIRLVEKLGGKKVQVYKPLENFDLAIIKYHLLPVK